MDTIYYNVHGFRWSFEKNLQNSKSSIWNNCHDVVFLEHNLEINSSSNLALLLVRESTNMEFGSFDNSGICIFPCFDTLQVVELDTSM